MIYRYLRALWLLRNSSTLSRSLILLVKGLYFWGIMIFRRGYPESVNISGTGVFIIFYNKVVFYIPLFANHEIALGNSHSIHCKMQSNIGCLLFYSMKKLNFYNTSYYILSRLTIPESIVFEYSDLKRRLPVATKFKGELGNFESLPWREYDFGWPLMNQYRDSLLKCTIESDIGFVHGDLHYGNIMQAKSGGYVLIDLDKASMSALQLYDIMHLIIEKYVFEYSKDWISALSKRFFVGEFSSIQIGFYIVNRVYLESMYGVKTSSRFKRRVEFLLFEISENIHWARI
jgi:hypothetical protein